MNAMSRIANVPVQTVINLVSGKSWGDLAVADRLEARLGTRLGHGTQGNKPPPGHHHDCHTPSVL